MEQVTGLYEMKKLNTPLVKVLRLTETAKMPEYANEGDSGADVFSDEETFILGPEERRLVKTGIKIVLPKNYEAQVRSKSGIAFKAGVMVLNSPGTIDEPYRGEVGIILHNTSHKSYVVEKGDKIAQLVFKPVYQAEFEEISEITDETTRSEKGFGSSGLKAKEDSDDNSK